LQLVAVATGELCSLRRRISPGGSPRPILAIAWGAPQLLSPAVSVPPLAKLPWPLIKASKSCGNINTAKRKDLAASAGVAARRRTLFHAATLFRTVIVQRKRFSSAAPLTWFRT